VNEKMDDYLKSVLLEKFGHGQRRMAAQLRMGSPVLRLIHKAIDDSELWMPPEEPSPIVEAIRNEEEQNAKRTVLDVYTNTHGSHTAKATAARLVAAGVLSVDGLREVLTEIERREVEPTEMRLTNHATLLCLDPREYFERMADERTRVHDPTGDERHGDWEYGEARR
jgi:hypothetical protein